MSYLLDTNVLSELVRKEPSEKLRKWFNNTPDNLLYISVLTLGELRKGVEKITDIKRRERVLIWLEQELPAWFDSRVLPIDAAIADTWGRLNATINRPLPVIDSLLAATALQHHLRLVTRNHKDFDFPSLNVINPWEL